MIWNLILTVAITLMLATVMFVIEERVVSLCFAAILTYCLWATVDAIRLVRDRRSAVSPMNSLLLEMQRQRDAIMRWMRQQMRVALFVYPFAIAGGFCWGGIEGSGTDLRTFMSKPAVLSLLLVVIAVLVPLCYFCSKWLFKLWFGRHLEVLGARIRELEA